ncbi:MAG: TRL-like family protein [Desulfobacterales bacterium]|nr:TRL-like family protein [Desulfobacterales bacterium]
MKQLKLICFIGLIALIPMMVGCATSVPIGGIYTKVKLPVDGEYAMSEATKVGTAECTSILNMVATGDASIQAAMENGNISKIHHVDWDVENILGVYGVYTVTVYGE